MLVLELGKPRVDPQVLRVNTERAIDELGVVAVFADEKGDRLVGFLRQRNRSAHDATFALLRHGFIILPV